MKPSELEWLRDVVYPDIRQPADRALLQAAATEVQTSDESGKPTPGLLDSLMAGMQSRSTIVTSSCSRWLFRFAADHAAALDCLMELLHNGKSSAREAIVRCVGFNDKTNVPFEQRVLRDALQDSSTKLRALAAERIESAGWVEMLPDVEAAAKDAKHGKVLSHCAEDIRRGYSILQSGAEDENPTRWIRYGRLGLLHSPRGSMGLRIPDDVLASLGIDEIVRRARVRHEWPGTLTSTYPGKDWDPVPDPDRPDDVSGFDPVLVAARVAFANYQRSRNVTPDITEKVLAALRGSEETTVRSAAYWILFLAKADPKLAASLPALFAKLENQSRSALFSATRSEILSSEKTLPDEFCTALLIQGLLDAKSDIRWLASIQILESGRKPLVPELKTAWSKEADPKTRLRMEDDIHFLTVGYKMAPLERGKIRLDVYRRRFSRWGVMQVVVPKKVVDQLGEAETVARVRRRLEWTGKRGKANLWDPL